MDRVSSRDQITLHLYILSEFDDEDLYENFCNDSVKHTCAGNVCISSDVYFLNFILAYRKLETFNSSTSSSRIKLLYRLLLCCLWLGFRIK